MRYRETLRGRTYVFDGLRDVLAKANEVKSGDSLAGIAAASDSERVAAKIALSQIRLSEIVAEPVVEDAVTAALLADHRAHEEKSGAFAEIADLTVGEFRELVLSPEFPARWEAGLSRVILPEVAAAVAKLMGDLDLVLGAAPLRVVTRLRDTIGQRGVFASRIQPNHPTDDLRGVLLSTLDGLLFGCGDAVIGVNPAGETPKACADILWALDDLLERVGAPTQACVLGHISTQLGALVLGAPVDLLFQSVAGTEAALASYGISLSLLSEGREAVLSHHRDRPGRFIGDQVMYFETGQGSALSADAHHGVGGGVDQLTLEARAQAVGRLFDPFLLNSVVGFIGPEYLADSRQITRAGLEDHFVGKLMGVPTGCDVCYTNHVDADQSTNDDLLLLLASAGCPFVMGVPAGDDVMLNYQSTSYHDVASVRRLLGLNPAPEFQTWLEEVGLWQDGILAPAGTVPISLAPALAALTA